MSKQLSYHFNDNVDPLVKNSVIQTKIYRDNVEVVHERVVYSFLDLLGDLGGVTEIITLAFGIFLLPISEHSFYVAALKKMYMARTKDDTLFR